MKKTPHGKVVGTPQVKCKGRYGNLKKRKVTLKVYESGRQEVLDCRHLLGGKCQRDYTDKDNTPQTAYAGQRVYEKCHLHKR